ncbi:MAG TPA: lytic transglycosylase domain-containing protein [Kofleriaceae bacterium]|nr:lytic transglycosylase domain-containing protein [Kofleriaceae bacterium]
MRRALTSLMLLLAFGTLARADIYSYTDDEGVVHFTNLKPSGGGKWKKVLDSAPPKDSKAAVDRGPRYDKVGATDHSPERFHRYDQYIYEASELYRIPVPLIRAVIKTESDFDPHVVSGLDCKGLMQVHPAVQLDMGAQGDIFDPRTNIMTGTRLLRYLANRLDGDLVLTIAAYHAGLGSLAKFGYAVPPYTYTRQYLKMVLERYYQYKTQETQQRVQ